MNTNHRSRKLWYLALPILFLVACVLQPAPAGAQMTSVGIDCSQIHALGIDKQDNLRAGLVLIECGLVQGGHPSGIAGTPITPTAPPNVRASNRACSSSSSCTKSESNAWASTKNPNQIVVNYNDSAGNGSSYTGTSYSSDGGVTFHEIQPPPFLNGHGGNFGDPIVVFNSKLNKFFAGDLASSCGGFGIGLWTSNNGKTWATGSCAHNGGSDDRESFWVDNNATSGTYGRMYISFNDFTNNGGALSLVYSDDGNTWTGPVILNPNFIRDVQVTGTPRNTALFEGKNSTVFVAAMDEGGGGNSTRQNIMYKSLDGGKTWTSTTLGPRFNPPGNVNCGYFQAVAPIWRHMGWGEPAVGPKGVVHYDYAGAGTNGDVGDIFYVRSIDNGKTWSTPIKLNTDKDNQFRTQWMPSLSVDKTGDVTASWYDRRAATSSCVNVTDKGCEYERVGRQSKNNGKSWMPDITISTALIPQPAQDDPTVQSCYAGDYDYNTATTGNALVTWTDGRRSVGGVHVQDVEFAKVPLP
jgi:hypothetical protein